MEDHPMTDGGSSHPPKTLGSEEKKCWIEDSFIEDSLFEAL